MQSADSALPTRSQQSRGMYHMRRHTSLWAFDRNDPTNVFKEGHTHIAPQGFCDNTKPPVPRKLASKSVLCFLWPALVQNNWNLKSCLCCETRSRAPMLKVANVAGVILLTVCGVLKVSKLGFLFNLGDFENGKKSWGQSSPRTS